MTKLINRNTTIPSKKLKVFSTAANGQTAIEVKIYQGERELSRTTNCLAISTLLAFHLHPKAFLKSRLPLTLMPVSHLLTLRGGNVFLLFYVDGIVNVSAKDKVTGKDRSMTISSSSGLSEKDIEKMVADAEQFAETDKACRSLITDFNTRKQTSICADTEKS